MYNQAPRELAPASNATPKNVGPATYTLCENLYNKKNAVPFLSSTKRVTMPTKNYCENIYNINIKQHIQGGTSPSNRAPRAPENTRDFVYNETIRATKNCKDTICCPLQKSKGKLYVCRAPLSVGGSPPSIPTNKYLHGYEIDSRGGVKPHKSVQDFREIGPQTYYVNYNFGCEKYKGCQWSNRVSQRSIYKANNNPGPGDYEFEKPISAQQCAYEQNRQMARLLTFLPRSLDSKLLSIMKEGQPGPGYYNIDRIKDSTRSASVVPKPFISVVDRNFYKIINSPSPADYDVIPQKYEKCCKCTEFGSKTERFSELHDNLPGPASYEIKSSMQVKLDSKKNKYASFQPPFNTTMRRFSYSILQAPSPQDYDVKMPTCPRNSASAFKSKTRRFKIMCKSANENLYSTEAFKKCYYPVSHNVSKLPFGTTSKRNVFPDLRKSPAPTDFNIRDDKKVTAFAFSTVPRFREFEDTPGPSTYIINPKNNESVAKAFTTHNIFLKERILKMKLRLAPKETYPDWVECVKGHKKLRWFLNRGKNYSHCK